MEVCVDNIQSVINASNGGAQRMELCSALNVGGLTPTVGFMLVARTIVPKSYPLYVMIRPRAGDYVYSENEISIMLEDIKCFKQNGADGFVFGCLDAKRCVDEKSCTRLIKEAHPLPCTFHRAFDRILQPIDALEILERLGFSRVLTSGLEKTALHGKNFIRIMIRWCKENKKNIVIMPGGGIDKSNLNEILQDTLATEFHGSAKAKQENLAITVTDENLVREMVLIGTKFGCKITNRNG